MCTMVVAGITAQDCIEMCNCMVDMIFWWDFGVVALGKCLSVAVSAVPGNLGGGKYRP